MQDGPNGGGDSLTETLLAHRDNWDSTRSRLPQDAGREVILGSGPLGPRFFMTNTAAATRGGATRAGGSRRAA
jgi:hypothetical protein